MKTFNTFKGEDNKILFGKCTENILRKQKEYGKVPRKAVKSLETRLTTEEGFFSKK